MAVCQNLVPLVNIKIAGKWMFIPLKMVLIGIDPYPHDSPPLIAKEKWQTSSSICSMLQLQIRASFPAGEGTGPTHVGEHHSVDNWNYGGIW